jgi:hypothetical protein
MATKLSRKQLPAGTTPSDFTYKGVPARDQGDFGSSVGIADLVCVNQFGEANNSKYYHGGVVQAKTGNWFVYLEWGRIVSVQSWNGSTFAGGDFQFVQCDSEADARAFFQKQCTSKNTKRLTQRVIGGKTIWTALDGEDGYLVQRLATRTRGLPDACSIKDDTGIVKATAPVTASVPDKKTAKKKTTAKVAHQPAVMKLAADLVGGVQNYTRALSAAAGVTPTMDAITEVRDELVPLALQRIQAVGNDIQMQVRDADLIGLSKLVSALVPREIPRTGISAEEAILSAGNIMRLQQDLDAFEAALKSESFDVTESSSETDPCTLLNAGVVWLDPKSPEWQKIVRCLLQQTNNRHGYLSGTMRVMNLFKIERPDRDAKFMAAASAVAGKRQGRFSVKANLQPVRSDLTPSEAEVYGMANVIFTQHGTRSVNIHPIMSTHFRLPKQLSGVPLAGANFGHGTYSAVDYRKAVGYTSYERSAWGGGNGAIRGRGAFMFLLDTIMGEAYLAPSTGSWTQPPNGCDSVFGRGGDRGHRLENDEHVVFDPNRNRIRYLVEFTF